MANGPVMDVSRLIDDRPIGRLQVLVIALAASVNLLDGVDTQSIGVAAPFIATTLGIKMAEFGPVFAAALLGAVTGAISFGAVADRVGRKPLLVLAVVIFGCFTLLTSTATSYNQLLLYRVCAGVGLGGATPCFITLTSEYAPARHRAALVTLMWAAFPLGGMMGAFLNAFLIPEFGWRAIFYIGGTLPLVLAAVLAVFMPDSLKFLVLQPNRAAAAWRVLRRMGIAQPPGSTLTVHDDRLPGLPLRQVFSGGRVVGTLLLWVPFFMGFEILSAVTLWTPTLLRMNGISPSNTAFVVAFNGMGAVFGQGLSGRLVERFGVAPVLIPSFLLGGLATAAMGYGASSVALASLAIGLVGLFIGFATGGCIALASLIYPTAMRSSGVGMGMAAGRLGQFCSPLLAGVLLGAGWEAGPIMLFIGGGGLVGAIFVLLLQGWLARHRTEATETILPNVAGTEVYANATRG